MKKSLTFFLLILLCHCCMASNKWLYGLDVFSSIFDYNPRLLNVRGAGVSYTLNAERYFSNKISFKTGLGLEHKKFKDEIVYFDMNREFSKTTKYKYKQANIPFLLSLHLGRKQRWYVDSGAAFKLAPQTSSSAETNYSMIQSKKNSSTISLQLGLGYSISAGNFVIDLGSRLNYGLTKTRLIVEGAPGCIRDFGLVIGTKYEW